LKFKNSFIYLTNCATLDILVSLDIIIFHLAIMLKFFYMTFLDKELVSHCELGPCMSWFKTWIMISFLSILYTFLHLGHIIMHLSKSINHQSNMKIVFQFSIILYKKSWSQWPTKKSCYIILSNIQIQLCSFLLEWKWVYLFFHFLFILSLVFGPIQLIHWGKENGLSSTTQKQTIRKWAQMNYELQLAQTFLILVSNCFVLQNAILWSEHVHENEEQ
jgi:hypothetical protein